MKKITSILSFVSILSLFLMTTSPVFAGAGAGAGAALGGNGEDICARAGSNFAGLCKIRIESGAGGIVGSVMSALLIIAILVSLFFLILGGIRWMTSGGDKGKIDSARSTLIAAVIGLVIALSAFAIINVILYFVTGQGLAGAKIPRLID